MGSRHVRPAHPDFSSFLVNDANSILFYCTYPANESPLPVLGCFRLHTDRLSHIALTLAGAKERTLKTGRGHFQCIAPGNRVMDIKHIAQLSMDSGTIVKCHPAGVVQQDPQYPAAILGQQVYAPQLKTFILSQGSGQGLNLLDNLLD